MPKPAQRFKVRQLPGSVFLLYGIYDTRDGKWIPAGSGETEWSTIDPLAAAHIATKLGEAMEASDAFTKSMERLVTQTAPSVEDIERLRQGVLALGVEPMDLTAPAETLIAVPWTTPTTGENAFARTLELADLGHAAPWPATPVGMFLSTDPGPLWSLVRMPDGTNFEGVGNSLEEAEADARKRWLAWKAAGGTAQPVATPACRVYWGSHGCMHQRGHAPEIPHECDCCACGTHPDPDSGCVAKPPYYGQSTRFYGEDAEALGLPLVEGTAR